MKITIIQHHLIVLIMGGLLVGLGIVRMFDLDVTPADTILGVFELDKGRVDSTSLLHQYSPQSNSLSVYISLGAKNLGGTINYEFPGNAIVDSTYLDKQENTGIRVHTAIIDLKLNVYVKYTDTAFAQDRLIFEVDVPPNEKTVMGMYIFRLPLLSNLVKSDFPVRYSFYPETSAQVSVSGSVGTTSPSRANGYIWNDLKKIQEGTTISVETPSLARSGQLALILGAILIAIGINLVTTHIYEAFKPSS